MQPKSDKKTEPDVIPSSIFGYAWRFTKPQQIWVLAIVLLSMPTYFFALDLPKQIVNGPIQGRGFEAVDATGNLLNITIDLPDFIYAGPAIEIFQGFTLGRLDMLIGLSLLFLFMVLVNGLFKFYINTYKGRLGERVLRRLRYQLIDRVLRFPIPYFRRVKSAEIASMVKDEVDPIGGFIGDAFVTPVFVGGQALTALLFIIVQNVWLGGIAFVVVLGQGIIIPRLRRRLVDLSRQRQLVSRSFAGRVSELVEGIGTVHTNDVSNYERAEASSRLGQIFRIRYELYQRKFFVKFFNNLLAQITPFLFYLIGGYFAVTGTLDIGQLVAVIAAYKDLPGPIKDLINWDQQRLDVQVKYMQVIEQFNVDEITSPAIQELQEQPAPNIEKGFELRAVSSRDDIGTVLFEPLSFTLEKGERLALLGGQNSGAEAIAEALVRLMPVTGGQILLDGTALSELPESVTGRRIGYVASDPTMLSGTVADNIFYRLKYVPAQTTDHLPVSHEEKWQRQEARATGNSELDFYADWIGYGDIGVSNNQQLRERLHDILEVVELRSDIMAFGIRFVIDPQDCSVLANRILKARELLQVKLMAPENAGLVEFFTPDKYARQAEVVENMLFGKPVGAVFASNNFVTQPFVKQLLAEDGLDATLYDMGREIATITIELFSDLPPDHPFFEELTFMAAEDIPEYQILLKQVQNLRYDEAPTAARIKLMQLPLLYIEPRHRLGLIDEHLEARLISFRQRFQERLPDNLVPSVAFYEPGAYNTAAPIRENILFGHLVYGIAGGEERLLNLARTVLDDLGLVKDIIDVGLDFDIGSSGKRLRPGQRQKIALAGALLKNPDILVLNRILSALDRQTQSSIMDRLLNWRANEDSPPPAILAVVNSADLASKFDTVLVMDGGKLIEKGDPQSLREKAGQYARLLTMSHD